MDDDGEIKAFFRKNLVQNGEILSFSEMTQIFRIYHCITDLNALILSRIAFGDPSCFQQQSIFLMFTTRHQNLKLFCTTG